MPTQRRMHPLNVMYCLSAAIRHLPRRLRVVLCLICIHLKAHASVDRFMCLPVELPAPSITIHAAHHCAQHVGIIHSMSHPFYVNIHRRLAGASGTFSRGCWLSLEYPAHLLLAHMCVLLALWSLRVWTGKTAVCACTAFL